jgi:Gly-Xaa carboxypeptidase
MFTVLLAVHTGIGLTALVIAELERNPHTPYLNPKSPLVNAVSCAVDFSPNAPSHLRRAIHKVEDSLKAKGKVNKKALKEVEDWWAEGSAMDGTFRDGLGRAMVSTTQAVDIINGGVKVNALVSSID